MIKNVIFDFGQVMVRFDPAYMVGRYVTDAADAAILADAVFDRLYWDRLDDGTIEDEEVVRLASLRVPERLRPLVGKIYYNWIYNLPEIEGMHKLVCDLKKRGIGVYLLSNISRYFAAHAKEIPCLAPFDGCVFSAEVGLVKPSGEIFAHICERFGIDKGECVFIDDSEKNIRGALAFGIEGYLFDGDSVRLREFLRTRIGGEL